jgi:predicted HTH transcriptional regulator
MATVHNAYYNSPWIETAARNLASALAPQDPEKTLEMQREKWKFQRLQELSRLEDEQRGLHKSGVTSLGALLADANEKAALPQGPWKAGYSTAENPAMTHVMDDDAFQGHINTALAGDVPFNDVVTAARSGSSMTSSSPRSSCKG